MYKLVFFLGLIIFIGSILLIGGNFMSGGPNPGDPNFMQEANKLGNIHLIGMGLLLLGGMLMGLSAVMKKAKESGNSILDEMLNASSNANQGKIINQGNNTFFVVGENNVIESNHENAISDQNPTGKIAREKAQKKELMLTEWKELIGRNKIEECIKLLIEYFKRVGNKSALNDVIQFKSRLRENEDRYNNNLIDDEFSNRERAKISRAILELMDNEIDN